MYQAYLLQLKAISKVATQSSTMHFIIIVNNRLKFPQQKFDRKNRF